MPLQLYSCSGHTEYYISDLLMQSQITIETGVKV
jgi:hypothetical protein